MSSVEFDDTELRAVFQNIEEMLSPAGAVEFLQGSVVPHLQRRASDRFAAQGDDVSGSWAPLAPATWAWRTALGYEPFGPINVREGELERYVTGGSGAFSTTGQDEVVMDYPGGSPGGSLRDSLEGAQYGQKGSPGQPPRPVLAVGQQDAEMVLGALIPWTLGKITGGARTTLMGVSR